MMESFATASPYELKEAFYWDLAVAYSFLHKDDRAARTRLYELWSNFLRGSRPPTPVHERLVRAALDDAE
jgi:hypothetical protein